MKKLPTDDELMELIKLPGVDETSRKEKKN
jgi:hypothetical protein